MTVAYDDFLAAKQQVAKPAGLLDVTAADVHPLLKPHQRDAVVWAVARMRTLNMLQQRHGLTQHLCPLQFDICDRIIAQHTMPGEVVFDPFAGIMTVPYCAVKLGRQGLGVELNAEYFRDGVAHLRAAETHDDSPTLFDLDDDMTAEEATS